VFFALMATRGVGVDLEADEEVVGDGDELLPGAIGAVVVGGDGVEGEMALELTDDLFVFASSGHEVPKLAGT